MKTLFILTALFISFQASATSILGVYYANGDDSDFETYSGLGENGFSSSDHACFIGAVTGVCALVKKEARDSRDHYSSGDHGYFEVRACSVMEDSVTLAYERITDYGNENVELKLEKCSADIAERL